MPTYEYLCEVNNVEFEKFHSIKTELEECPICGEQKKDQHKPKRLISGGSGKGTVVLTGHELMAKTKEDTQKLKQEVYSDSKKYANIVGEERYHNIQTKMDRNR